jgi:hypothetical protein
VFSNDYIAETIVSPKGRLWDKNQFKEGTMKYVCLIYQDEVALEKLPKEEMGKLTAEYKAFHEDIR